MRRGRLVASFTIAMIVGCLVAAGPLGALTPDGGHAVGQVAAAPAGAGIGDLAGSFDGTGRFDFGLGCSTVHQVFDATYPGAVAVGTVTMHIAGCLTLNTVTGAPISLSGSFTMSTTVGTVTGTAAGVIGTQGQPAPVSVTLTVQSGTGAFAAQHGALHVGGNYFFSQSPGEADPFRGTVSTAPTCVLSRVVNGPPKRLEITAQDVGAGLSSIQATKLVNSTVSIPAFTNGTHLVVVTATKVDASRPSQVELTVTNVVGNVAVCDPVMVTLARGLRNATTLSDVARAEHVVTVRNGSPGLRVVLVSVNGTRFRVGIRPGRERSIDVGSAMNPGDRNSIVLVGGGPRGGLADVLVWDGNGTI